MPKSKKKVKKALTLKDVGLVDDGRLRLSDSYANSKRYFKVVEDDHIIGFYFVGGNAKAKIAPIYHATIYSPGHMATSHEIGEYYNPEKPWGETPDYAADGLALAASTAIAALQRHAQHQKAQRSTRKK